MGVQCDLNLLEIKIGVFVSIEWGRKFVDYWISVWLVSLAHSLSNQPVKSMLNFISFYFRKHQSDNRNINTVWHK